MKERKKEGEFFDGLEKDLKDQGKVSNRQILFVIKTKGDEIVRELMDLALKGKPLSELKERESSAEKIVQLKFIRALRKFNWLAGDDEEK